MATLLSIPSYISLNIKQIISKDVNNNNNMMRNPTTLRDINIWQRATICPSGTV